MSKQKIIGIVLATCVALGQSQVGASSVTLIPSSGTFIANCPFSIDIMIDTKEVASTAVGLSLFSDDSVYAINDLSTTDGVFSTYTTPTASNANFGPDKKRPFVYFVGTTTDNKGFQGQGKFGTLTITPLLGVNEMDLEFYMLPNFDGDDSNIPYYSGGEVFDSLDTITNGSYTFIKGECDVDKIQVMSISKTIPTQIHQDTAEIETEIEDTTPSKDDKVSTNIDRNTSFEKYKNYAIIFLIIIFIISILSKIFRKKD